MNISISRLRISSLTFVLFSLLMVNCKSDDSDTVKEEITDNLELTKEEIVAISETKATLVGEWVLISSSINNENITPSEFSILKQSKANFKEDNTYKIVYKMMSSTSSGTSVSTDEFTGTYKVDGKNKVTFFKSTSVIKLLEDRLEITRTITNSSGVTQTQVDVFVRSDSKELEVVTEENVIDEEEKDTEILDTFDGTAVTAKLLGKWKLSEGANECLKKNTIEFKAGNVLEFIQHKATFTRNDLLRSNISVSFPAPAKFSTTATKGSETVVFDTEADCQFKKTNQLEYVVTGDTTVLIKNVAAIKISLENDTTFKLVYKNGENQETQFTYVKL